jgi:hydroxymethylglutaryl-CoA synthase
LAFESFSSDTPDFWRREGMRYPSHGGRFTGKPSYFYHIEESTKSIFKKTGYVAKDFAYAVFHMPNGKFPIQVAKSLGFSTSQIRDSLTVNYLGNSYTASALIGFAAVLEKAMPGDLIFLCSYGSGAGSDSFVFKVTKNILKRRKDFAKMAANKEYIDYPTYLKFMEMI